MLEKNVTIDTEKILKILNFLIQFGKDEEKATGGKSIMKLSFRGISYNHDPVTLETTNTEIEGTYRGIHWKNHPYAKSRHGHGFKNMTYRGIHYLQN